MTGLAPPRATERDAALPWRLVWLALALHVAGLTVDTIFHDSETRPFSAFEMLWAHGLSYLGAATAIVGGTRAARGSGTNVGCRWAGTLVATLGAVQALSLALDFVTEVLDADLALGPIAYAFSLVAMAIATFVGAWLCRRSSRVASESPATTT